MQFDLFSAKVSINNASGVKIPSTRNVEKRHNDEKNET